MSSFRPTNLFGPYSKGMAGQPTDAEKWSEGFGIVVFVVLVMFRSKSPWLYLAALSFMSTSFLFLLLFVREAANLRKPWMHQVLYRALPAHCLLLGAIVAVWMVVRPMDDWWFFGVITASMIVEACLAAMLLHLYRPKSAATAS